MPVIVVHRFLNSSEKMANLISNNTNIMLSGNLSVRFMDDPETLLCIKKYNSSNNINSINLLKKC